MINRCCRSATVVLACRSLLEGGLLLPPIALMPGEGDSKQDVEVLEEANRGTLDVDSPRDVSQLIDQG
jgi:hypothetical protein